MTAIGGGRLGVEGWSKREKGRMDMDSSGDCRGEGSTRRLNGNGKYNKKLKKNIFK